MADILQPTQTQAQAQAQTQSTPPSYSDKEIVGEEECIEYEIEEVTLGEDDELLEEEILEEETVASDEEDLELKPVPAAWTTGEEHLDPNDSDGSFELDIKEQKHLIGMSELTLGSVMHEEPASASAISTDADKAATAATTSSTLNNDDDDDDDDDEPFLSEILATSKIQASNSMRRGDSFRRTAPTLTMIVETPESSTTLETKSQHQQKKQQQPPPSRHSLTQNKSNTTEQTALTASSTSSNEYETPLTKSQQTAFKSPTTPRTKRLGGKKKKRSNSQEKLMQRDPPILDKNSPRRINMDNDDDDDDDDDNESVHSFPENKTSALSDPPGTKSPGAIARAWMQSAKNKMSRTLSGRFTARKSVAAPPKSRDSSRKSHDSSKMSRTSSEPRDSSKKSNGTRDSSTKSNHDSSRKSHDLSSEFSKEERERPKLSKKKSARKTKTDEDSKKKEERPKLLKKNSSKRLQKTNSKKKLQEKMDGEDFNEKREERPKLLKKSSSKRLQKTNSKKKLQEKMDGEDFNEKREERPKLLKKSSSKRLQKTNSKKKLQEKMDGEDFNEKREERPKLLKKSSSKRLKKTNSKQKLQEKEVDGINPPRVPRKGSKKPTVTTDDQNDPTQEDAAATSPTKIFDYKDSPRKGSKKPAVTTDDQNDPTQEDATATSPTKTFDFKDSPRKRHRGSKSSYNMDRDDEEDKQDHDKRASLKKSNSKKLKKKTSKKQLDDGAMKSTKKKRKKKRLDPPPLSDDGNDSERTPRANNKNPVKFDKKLNSSNLEAMKSPSDDDDNYARKPESFSDFAKASATKRLVNQAMSPQSFRNVVAANDAKRLSSVEDFPAFVEEWHDSFGSNAKNEEAMNARQETPTSPFHDLSKDPDFHATVQKSMKQIASGVESSDDDDNSERSAERPTNTTSPKIPTGKLQELSQGLEKKRLNDDNSSGSSISAGQSNDSDSAAGFNGASTDESDDYRGPGSFSNLSLGPEQVKSLDAHLQEQGLPTILNVGDNRSLDTLSMGEESYVQDLIHQQATRNQKVKEESLEDALGLYKKALEKFNLPDNESLFIEIFNQVLKENTAKWEEKFQEQDDLLLEMLEEREEKEKEEQEEKKKAGLNGVHKEQNEEPRNDDSSSPDIVTSPSDNIQTLKRINSTGFLEDKMQSEKAQIIQRRNSAGAASEQDNSPYELKFESWRRVAIEHKR